MKKSLLLVSFLLIQLLISQPVFAQYPMIYEYLMELGVENFDYGDYREALHYFKKAQIINPSLHEEIAFLENKVEKLRTQRREDQVNFYKQLKEEIASVRQRYTQRLRDIKDKLEKANLEREKLYKQMEEMIAKIEEKGLKILEEKVQREAEEMALDKYEKKVKSDKRGEGN